MSKLNPFPHEGLVDIVILIGNKRLPSSWPVVPRVGEVIHGYMLGTRFFSGRVMSVEHHFSEDGPTIEVRLPSRSWI